MIQSMSLGNQYLMKDYSESTSLPFKGATKVGAYWWRGTGGREKFRGFEILINNQEYSSSY